MKDSFKNNEVAFKILLSFLLSTFYFPLSTVFAQTDPEFLVSWRASDYVPADYQGKALPSKSSTVGIGFDVIDGNRAADLSKNNISWYLGNNQIDSGTGLKEITMKVADELDQSVRITVSGYKNGNDLDFGFVIPVASPKIVVDTKTPTVTANNQRYLPLQSYLFEARPFFFNINRLSDLTFRWQINNQPVEGAAGNPEFLSLNLESQGTPKESQFTVSASAGNNANQLEFSGKLLNFIVK